jgi:hypothetical protein
VRQLPAVVLPFAVTTSVALAQTAIIVPDHYPTIGAAIQAASPGAAIHVRAQTQAYPPFVIDRPIAIVGSGVDNDAPRVAVAQGVGISVQLAAGQRASITRIDCVPVAGAVLTQALVVTGGHLTLEDCRFQSGHDPAGSAGLAGVDVLGADVTLLLSRIEGGTRAIALRATSSRVALAQSRCFGATNGAGVLVHDSTLHGNDSWLFGGENFVGGAGGAGLVVSGASAVWLSDVEIRGGMGTLGGSAIVNTTAVPVELRAATTSAGSSFGGGSPPVLVGPSTVNPNLLALRWNEPPYRRGSLRPGQPWSVALRGPASSPVALAFSFGPLGTAATWTRQPAMSLGDVVAMVALTTNGSGQAIHPGSVPNTTALFGAGLWGQAIGGPAFPFEASPHVGAVVRPY